ncbi:aminoglycoside adenyltransferase [Frankia sp. AiPs1]|uniref:aminoglycoside adenyltransferase n=1 Tax=Frankia sp. AiPs1 TaxID=573493 RepID=UPI002043AF21|nr:aminoglycoside adenyltransferase [Frankia sp. AiPs1]MCM3920288.1 aminoglycoside adenyltransferase [Frankia sp. AiPs1]
MLAFQPAAGAWTGGDAGGGLTEGPALPAAGSGFVAQRAISAPSLGGLLGRGVGGGVSGLMSAAAQAVASWMASSLVASSRSMLTGLLGASTNPRVTAAAFIGHDGAYRDVASFASLILVAFVSLGVAQGMWSGEPGQALLRLVRDVPVAVLAILVFPWITDQMIILSDVMSTWMLPSGKYAAENVGKAILPYTAAPGGNIGVLLLNQLVFFAIAMIYLELVVRTALTYVAVALAPLSFMTMTTSAGRAAARKAIELVVAVVMIKPGIFLVLRIGIDLTGVARGPSSTDGSDWGGIFLGMGIAGVAAFMPWIIWRLIPSMEQAAITQGLSRAPFRAGMQAMQTAYFGSSLASSLARAGGRSAPGGAGARGAGAAGSGGGLGASRSLATRFDGGSSGSEKPLVRTGTPAAGARRPDAAGGKGTPAPSPRPTPGAAGRRLVDPDQPAEPGAGPSPPRRPGARRRPDSPGGGR